MRPACALFMVLLTTAVLPAPAAEPQNAEGLALFDQKIRPVLERSCYQCHSVRAFQQRKLEAGLLLDSREGVRNGGESGPAVMNAANEVAVHAFLEGRLPFIGIVPLAGDVLRRHDPWPVDSLEAAIEADWMFYAQALVQDSVFNHLAENERFRGLVARLEANMAEQRAWYEAHRDDLQL